MSRHHNLPLQPKPIGKPNQKVKIYFLSRIETWVDLGVGNLFQIREFDRQTEEQEEFIQVQAGSADEITDVSEIEEDERKKLNRNPEERIIIKFKFHPENYYEKQNDSIIICKEKETCLEFAISFTDAQSTNDFWDHIRKNNGTNLHENSQSINADQFDDLQMPHFNKLEETLEAIDNDLSHFSQGIIYKPEFLEKLFKTFDELENIQDSQKLHQIHLIVKKLILSNEPKLITILMNDKYFNECLGAFEYKKGKKENYREIQKKERKFKQIIEIKDTEILEKIHLNYRLQYVKDTIISNYIEDNISTTFNLMVMRNNIEIIEYIKEKQSLQELSSKFFVSLSDSIKFLEEMLSIISNPNFAMSLKPQLAEAMNNFDFIRIFFQALAQVQEDEKDQDLRTKQILKLMEAITILSNDNKRELVDLIFTSNEVSIEANQNCNHLTYLKQLASLMIKEDTGIQIQVVELFKISFEFFKQSDIDEKIIELILDDLIQPCIDNYLTLENSNQFSSFCVQFLDLFQIAYKLSPFKMASLLIRRKVIPLLFTAANKSNLKPLHLSLLKFTKGIIIDDGIMVDHLISTGVIDMLWIIYKKHERRPNIINSTFLDILNCFVLVNYTLFPKLFKHIMSSFGEEMKARANKNSFFKQILELHEKQNCWINQDRHEHLIFAETEIIQEPHALMEEIEEEKYFEQEDKQHEENVQYEDINSNPDKLQKKIHLEEKIAQKAVEEGDESSEYSLVKEKQLGFNSDKSKENNNNSEPIKIEFQFEIEEDDLNQDSSNDSLIKSPKECSIVDNEEEVVVVVVDEKQLNEDKDSSISMSNGILLESSYLNQKEKDNNNGNAIIINNNRNPNKDDICEDDEKHEKNENKAHILAQNYKHQEEEDIISPNKEFIDDHSSSSQSQLSLNKKRNIREVEGGENQQSELCEGQDEKELTYIKEIGEELIQKKIKVD